MYNRHCGFWETRILLAVPLEIARPWPWSAIGVLATDCHYVVLGAVPTEQSFVCQSQEWLKKPIVILQHRAWVDLGILLEGWVSSWRVSQQKWG